MSKPAAATPLEDLVVLDFTRVLAGPWASLSLADLGARVIKIEHPNGGDDTRRYDLLPDGSGESAYFLAVNRNKQSLALDITTKAGQEVIFRLAAKADVVIENFRADVMTRHGLGYDNLKQVNESLIYCSVTGYGHSSPNKMVAGYDPIAQAESGMMWMTGEPDGPPLRTGISYADMFTGMFACQAILGALHARTKDGLGQQIDIALLDSAAAVGANYAQLALLTGISPKRYGSEHPFVEPLGNYECEDGLISLICGNERQWQRFCKEGLERPELLKDPKLKDNASRVRNRDYTREIISSILKQKTKSEWIEKLRAAGMPVGIVRDLVEALAAPELRARGMVHTTTHERLGPIEQIASPMHFSRTPTATLTAPPLLGQHSRDCLTFAGLSHNEIEKLIQDGIAVETKE